MGYHEPDAADPVHSQRAYDGLVRDASIIKAAAKHLRWVGWFGLLWFGLMLAILFWVGGAAAFRVLLFLSVLSVILLNLAILYFASAHWVAQGKRWAIALALVLTLFSVLLTLLQIIAALKRRRPGQVCVDSIYLVFHLHLIKLLVQSWGAAGRIHALMQPARESLPAECPAASDGVNRDTTLGE